MDTAVARAVARKEAIGNDIERCRADIERLQTEMRDIDTFLALYARFAEADEDNASQATETSTPSHNGQAEDASFPAGNVSQEQFEIDARRLLIENGRPMKRGQLIRSFRSHGLRVGGTNEAKSFGAKIWRARDRFINISGEGYWPRDVDCPAVGYQPNAAATATDEEGLFKN
jgi:hypothetical protein